MICALPVSPTTGHDAGRQQLTRAFRSRSASAWSRSGVLVAAWATEQQSRVSKTRKEFEIRRFSSSRPIPIPLCAHARAVVSPPRTPSTKMGIVETMTRECEPPNHGAVNAQGAVTLTERRLLHPAAAKQTGRPARVSGHASAEHDRRTVGSRATRRVPGEAICPGRS